jgi:hypothetical protein
MSVKKQEWAFLGFYDERTDFEPALKSSRSKIPGYTNRFNLQ